MGLRHRTDSSSLRHISRDFGVLLIVLILCATAAGGTIKDSFPIPAYTIEKTPSGEDYIALSGAQGDERGTAGEPGAPDLPTISQRIAVPVNAAADSVKLTITNIAWQDVPGKYDISPVAIPAACVDGEMVLGIPPGKRIAKGRDISAYSNNADLPTEPAKARPVSQARKWKFVTVDFCPFRYNAVTKRLQVASACEYQITYGVHNITNSERRLLRDKGSDARVLQTLKNRKDADSWYKADAKGVPANSTDGGVAGEEQDISGGEPSAETSDYVVITTSAISSTSAQLANFVATRQSVGFKTLVVTEGTWGGGTGNTAAENIRTWLKNNYVSRGIEYVLLVGNPSPTSGDVPMKMCWPRKGAGDGYEESPTDYYYADLTGNWDLDGDGYYGECPGDVGAGGIDLSYEVVVGRIPFYGNYSELDAILAKLISYQTDTGDVSWRETGLIGAAISNYANEDNRGWSRTDGSDWGDYCKADIFDAAGASSSRQYEKAGISPVSRYSEWPLTRANFLNDWNNGYGFVTWWAHGSSTSASRKVWTTDDGDGVPESGEMSWYSMISSSDCASIAGALPVVMQCSCTNGYPESSNNLQYRLLYRGAIGNVGASRVSWYAIGSWTPSRGSIYGDNASYAYQIPKKMVLEDMTLGEANHWCRQNFGRGWAGQSYMNVYDFNVYGDPSLSITPETHTEGLVIVTTSLPDGQVGDVYTGAILAAMGGVTPYTWSVVGGALPAGLSLSASGTINGTPTASGTFNFTVEVTDSQSPADTATKALSINIAADVPADLVIVTSSLPGGAVGAAYSRAVSATGGETPYTWTLDSGSLPGGLSLSAGGVISGTPTTSGTFTFTVEVSDSQSPVDTATKALSIEISGVGLRVTSPNGGETWAAGARPSITWVPGPSKYVIIEVYKGGSFHSTISAATFNDGLYLWTIPSDIASGTDYRIKMTELIDGTASDSSDADFTIDGTGPADLVIETSSLPAGQVGDVYTGGILVATGGATPYMWSVVNGVLPAGLALSASGTISGTPTEYGTFNFTVQVADSQSPADTATKALSVDIAPADVAITTTNLSDGEVGSPYTRLLSATGGMTPYTWSVVGGSLPAGLALSSSGTISGTPTASGTFNFTVEVADSQSPADMATKALSIDISGVALRVLTPNGGETWTAGTRPSITWAPGPSKYVIIEVYKGGAFHSTVTSATFNDGLYLWTIPSDIASGTDYRIKLTELIGGTESDSSNADFAIAGTGPADLVILTSSLPAGQVRTPYSGVLVATGGVAPRTWSVVGGSLPAGLALSSSGTISGTPTASGTFNFTVQVADSQSPADTATKALSIDIAPEVAADLVIVTTSLPAGQVETVYSQTLSATGGVAPRTWSVIDGLLPAGIALSSSGTISGTPTASGTFNFAVEVSDSQSPSETATKALSIDISGASLRVTSPNGGETWTAGTRPSITWVPGPSKYVIIEVYKGGVLDSTISAATFNDGLYLWNIPSDIASGTDYRIKMTELIGGTASDSSNADFAITGGSSVTLEALSMSQTVAGPAEAIAVKGTTGTMKAGGALEANRIVIGIRDSSGRWVGGEPKVVYAGMIEGDALRQWSGADVDIDAPTEAGIYYFWAAATAADDDAAAVSDFKGRVPVSSGATDCKWPAQLIVQATDDSGEAYDSGPADESNLYPIEVGIATCSGSLDDSGRLVDGDAATSWQTLGNLMPEDESVTCDIGRSMRIGAVCLTPGEEEGLFPQEFTIEVSTDGERWEPVVYAKDFSSAGSSVWRFEPRRARYVRISGPEVISAQDGRYYWQLGEITVYRGIFGPQEPDSGGEE